MKTVKILGTGCPKCKTMEAIVREVIAENNIQAEVIKVEDIMEIMKYNIIQKCLDINKELEKRWFHN